MKKTSALPFFRLNNSDTLSISSMTLEVFRKLPSINKEGKLSDKELFDQQKAVILETTVLTEEQFEELTAPDFNTLANDCTAYILTGSDELQGKKLANDCYEFDLLFPFENEVGEKIEHIKFTVPKVKHSQALTDISEKQLREDFMFQVVCDLDKEDLQKMSVNDYLTIKPKVGDFFLQSAAYFQVTTSKT